MALECRRHEGLAATSVCAAAGCPKALLSLLIYFYKLIYLIYLFLAAFGSLLLCAGCL